jgi:PAS domain S-box-containing protein
MARPDAGGGGERSVEGRAPRAPHVSTTTDLPPGLLADAGALRESEERLRIILDHVQAGVLIVDSATHTIVDVNPAAAALIGAPREQLVGQACHNYVCQADVGRCPITDLHQNVDDSERVLLRADGSHCPILKTVVPIMIGGRPHLLESFIDITARKGAEQALATRTRHLEAIRIVAEDLTRELDLARLLRLLIARAADLVGASSATVYLWEPEQRLMIPAAWHGLGDWQAMLRHPLGQGVVGTVAQTRQPLCVNDYRTSRYANPVTLERTRVAASLGEPLLYRDVLIGAITLNHDEGRTFTEQDQALLRLFANQAAIAIANARLFREEHERRAQLEAVRGVNAEIAQELDLTQALRLVAQRACELTGATAVDIALWDAERQVLMPEASYGHRKPRPLSLRRLGEGAMGTVAQTRRGLLLNDYRSSQVAHPDTLAHTAITASLVEPLLYRDTLLGVIGVDHETPERSFSSQDQALLRLFADQAAIAIANARLYGETDRRRREAEVLASLAQSITASLDLDTVFQRVVDGAKGLCEGDVAALALREDPAGTLTFRTWAGTVSATYQALRIPAGQGLGGKVLVEGRPARTGDYRRDSAISPDFHGVAQIEGFHAEIAVPIRIEGKVTGVLFVMRRTARAFTDADEGVLARLADQAAIAIANARLFQDQQRAYAALHQAQEELIRAEKLRGLGQMAAGIAHDLNNMLATILGQVELLRLRAPAPEVREGLGILQTAANDGALVVRRLQDFARQRGGGPLSACDLSRLVVETLEITRPRWRDEPQRRGIVIETVVEIAGLPPVQGNPTEIREVLTNLIFNAVDAMPRGGRLRFAGRIVCDDASDPSPAAPEGDGGAHGPPWVELVVADSGIGMSREVRQHIFDPFYTTKGLHGTGLGLSVVYGIMERHGGHIEVDSIPGQETTFRLRFRQASGDPERFATPPPPPVPCRRILLVDDDPGVRSTLAALLRTSGQEVLEADGGAEALTRLATTTVDLVLTDLGMPDVTGWEVARAAKARNPNLPVVLLTGWGDQAGAEAPQDVRVDRLLAKPVPHLTVLSVIAELTQPH